MKKKALLSFVLLFASCILNAQSTSANITGRITDPTKAVIAGARITLLNTDTNIAYSSSTDPAGSYHVANVSPGNYRMEVVKQGFRTVIKPAIVLHVQDALELNFEMAVGAASESVTVEGGAPLVNTQDATVSTVVDRKFVENMPLNGRTFQTLISLTPGAVTTPSTFNEAGQFSVNGQRADANYFTIDGVSANIGTSAGSGLVQGLGGALPALSALGGTNALVSVDALQEFRIQTSTFAPEFGRTPGAQISIVTRSGTNQFHGTLFDYLRNDALDAKDWFVSHNNLPKPKERQNDFGGVIGGRILRDRTFFFFSYEGLRLRQPSFQTTFVPDLTARQTAPSALQPLLNAFPLPNGPEVGGNAAQLAASFSSPATLDAYGIRVDQIINSRLSLFGRYDYAPSELVSRGGGGVLSTTQRTVNAIHTGTLGLTAAVSSTLSNELRANYSNARAGTISNNDDFGGAVPVTSNVVQFPAGDNLANSFFAFGFLGVNGLGQLTVGKTAINEQRQINLVDNVSWAIRAHQVKWGVDYRWLAPISSPLAYDQVVRFSGLTGPNGALGGKATQVIIAAQAPTSFVSQNISLYGQDTWKLTSRLTLTYGLRWDVNPAVKGKNSQSSPLALRNVNTPAALSAAPFGSSLYQTSFTNVAPRLGVAYQMAQRNHWSTVIRGGGGIFYDIGSGSLGALSGSAPFFSSTRLSNVSYPLTAAQIAPPAFSTVPPFAQVNSADPNLSTPRTYQWNLAVEQEIGAQQLLSLTYVGAVGRDLLRQDTLISPNASFPSAVFITRSNATSDYDALQVRFQRHLSRGLQALASYTWSHSIDIASNDSSATNTPPSIGIQLDRGNSDFDVRHSMSAGLSYDIPIPGVGMLGRAILGGWSIDTLLVIRSAPPVTVLGNPFLIVAGTEFAARPNIVPGIPFYIYGSQFPGGKAFNLAAFSSATGATQGNLPRNFLRGFGAWQDDLAVRRHFRVTDKVGLQLRAEFFNVFNHPSFGSPVATLSSPNFGQAAQTLATTLSPGGIGAGLNPLYQIGGPRSIQIALKLSF